MKIKSISSNLNNIFILILSILLILTGCNKISNDKYNINVQKGLDSLIIENYEKAEVYFELALVEKPEEKKAIQLLKQTHLYIEAIDLFNKGNLGNAQDKTEKIIAIEEGSNALVNKAEELKSSINNINSNFSEYMSEYKEAELLFENGDSENSLTILDELLNNKNINEVHYIDIKDDSGKLRQIINDNIIKKQAQEVREKEEQNLAEAVEIKKNEDERREQEESEAFEELTSWDNEEYRKEATKWLTEAEELLEKGDQKTVWKLLIRGDIGLDEIAKHNDLKAWAYELAIQLDGHEEAMKFIEEYYGN